MNDPARFQQDINDVDNTIITRSGETLAARLIKPEDEELLVDFARSLSPKSRRRRFHQSVEHLSDKRIHDLAQQLADVDNYTKGGAVLALSLGDDGRPYIIGVSRLGRAPNQLDDPVADAAIVVRDDYHGEGVGTELLRRLVLLARQMKVKQMVAMIESDNSHAIRLFTDLGLPMEIEVDSGEMIFTIDLPD